MSFLTLEAIMRAGNKGIYADMEIWGRNTAYEPLADPKNREIILEHLPYLWNEDGLVLMADKLSDWDHERNDGSRERFRKLVEAIGAKPEELVDALGPFGGGPCVWNHNVLGGCFVCSRDCD